MIRSASTAEADRQLQELAANLPSSQSIPEITQTQGLDLATAALYHRILRLPENRRFYENVCQGDPATEIQFGLIGVVPGAFYQTHHDTGADGARVLRIAQALRCEAKLVPIKSFGRLEENAKIILDWIESQSSNRITLISLSKGSADVKVALASPGADQIFARVHTWINFSGIVQGTPLVEWLNRQRLRSLAIQFMLWWGGHDGRTLGQLQHGPGTPLANWPVLPSRLRIVHVYGFPLRHHLTHRWAPRGYERLATWGPNDGGGILLADLQRLPGIVFPIWGADHYLTPAQDLTELLQRIVVEALSLPVQAIP